jgi:hypothetical protein
MYAQYESHDDATLSYMDDPLHRFNTFKDVVLLSRASKKAMAKVNALSTELVKKSKVHKEINAETRTPSMLWHEINGWRDYISHGTDISK